MTPLRRNAPLILLLTFPVLLAAVWGHYPSEHAYQNLANIRHGSVTNNYPQGLIVLGSVLQPWLFPSRFLIVLTVLGWLIGMGALWRLLLQGERSRLVALLAALLFALHPTQFSLSFAGSGHTWVVALSLLALTLVTRSEERAFALTTLALLVVWVDWSTSAFIFIVLGWLFVTKRRFFPTTTFFTVLFLLLVAYSRTSLLDGIPAKLAAFSADITLPSITDFTTPLQQYLFESDFYWLALPLLLLGLWAARREQRVILLLLWAVLLSTRSVPLSKLMFAAAAVWLIALGLNEALDWLSKQERIAFDKRLPKFAVGLVALCLSIACLQSLHYRWQFRPIARFAAEDATLDFLATSDIPQDSFAASSRLSLLLDAPSYSWQGSVPQDAMALVANPPDVLLMPVGQWERNLSNALWLRQRYRPIERIQGSSEDGAQSSSSGQAEIRIFRKLALPTDALPPVTTPITTTFGLHLDSTTLGPESVQPSDTLNVLLNWRATATITPFGTVLNVTHPLDGTPYAQVDIITPNNLSNDWLQAGQLVPSYYQMTLVPDIPIGAYPVTLSTHKADSLVPEPILRAGEANTLDRSILAYVAVPWVGKPTGEPINAAYADGIALRSAEITGEATANGSISLRLYWQATQTPSQNYTIFVHFLDAAGQYITGADSVPFDGRYPTRGWHPGDTIPSDHILFLPAELPADAYQIKVGLYLPSTGDRLLATAADGTQPPDRSILLKTFDP